MKSWPIALVIALTAPVIGPTRAFDRSEPPPPSARAIAPSNKTIQPSTKYTTQQLRSISVFGARLSMRLEDARAALVANGLKREPFPQASRIAGEAQVLEADYSHPRDNTKVGIFYTQLPNKMRLVSRIVLWEQIPLMPKSEFDQFPRRRYGNPTNKTVFQGHDEYVWSQGSTAHTALKRSMQCMMNCITEQMKSECSTHTISSGSYMEGGYNTNMVGKLYWWAELNDLKLQRNSILQDQSYPRSRPICPTPVI